MKIRQRKHRRPTRDNPAAKLHRALKKSLYLLSQANEILTDMERIKATKRPSLVHLYRPAPYVLPDLKQP